MPDWESALATELSTRHHITTRTRLQRLGISRRVIDGLCNRGRLTHIGNGVLVSAARPATFEQRLAIACALTGGVISYPTAGKVWDFRKTPPATNIHVTVPRTRAGVSLPGWIVLHRSYELPRCDVVHRRDGIVVTSPPRTVFDAAAWLDGDDLESVVEQGIARGNFTNPTLTAHARRLCRRGRPGSSRFIDVLARRETWRRPVASDYELRLERAMRARGFPALTRQHPLLIAPGVVIHPDLGVPEHGFFVDVDHLTWHGGRLQGAYDRWRDLKVRASTDFRVERVTDIAIDRHLAETVEDLWSAWQRVRTHP